MTVDFYQRAQESVLADQSPRSALLIAGDSYIPEQHDRRCTPRPNAALDQDSIKRHGALNNHIARFAYEVAFTRTLSPTCSMAIRHHPGTQYFTTARSP